MVSKPLEAPKVDWHAAEVAGNYGDLRDWLLFRIAIGVFGVVLAALSYTGIVIWWRKRYVRRRFAHKPQSQSEAWVAAANSLHRTGSP